MTEQEQFLEKIEADLGDEALRLVYADWLDEHDAPEEAQRQRDAVPAIQWMKELAAKSGQHCEENYGEGHRWNRDTNEIEETGVVEKWVPITFAIVVQAGVDYVKYNGTEHFVQLGEEALRDHFDPDNYWKNWELVTGMKRLPLKKNPRYSNENHHNPFSCSC